MMRERQRLEAAIAAIKKLEAELGDAAGVAVAGCSGRRHRVRLGRGEERPDHRPQGEAE